MGRRVIAIACAALGLSAGIAQAHGLPKLFTGAGANTFAVRPATIDYTGDGTGVIGKLHRHVRPGSWRWKTWSASRAYGVGTIWLDDCVPDCAAGKFHSYNGSVTADRVRSGRLTRIAIRYRYHGHAVDDIRVLSHPGGFYEWTVG